MELNYRFDANTVAPSAGTAPLPGGMYNVVIESMSKEEVSRSTPQNPMHRLSLKMKVLDGQFAGRYVFHDLNLWLHDKPDAMERAVGELSAICHATGHLQIQQTLEELSNRPMSVNVALRPARTVKGTNGEDDKHYEASNAIRAFVKMSGPSQGGMQQPMQPQQPAFNQQPPAQQAFQQPAFNQQPAQQQGFQQPTQQGFQQPAQQLPPQNQGQQFPPQQQGHPDPANAAPPFNTNAQQPWPNPQPQQQAPAQQGGMPAWAQNG